MRLERPVSRIERTNLGMNLSGHQWMRANQVSNEVMEIAVNHLIKGLSASATRKILLSIA